MKVLVYDIETKINPAEVGWENYDKMGIGVGCAHCNWLPLGVENPPGALVFFNEEDFSYIYKMINLADVVSGYNIIGFDNPLLAHTAQRLGFTMDLSDLNAKSYDMYLDIKNSLKKREKGWKLDQVIKSTLGTAKLGSGADAPKWYQDGELNRLYSYVAQDVVVERQLFEHIINHGIVKSDESTSKILKLTEYKKITDIPLL